MNRVNPERGGGEWCEEDAIVKIMSSTSTDALRLPEIRISDLNILSSLRASYMFANTRFVWVKINNIGVMNTLLKRSTRSGI